MPFLNILNIRGLKIHCKKCGYTATIEFEGGASPSYFTGLSAFAQKRFSKKYMPSYNAEELGYYYHTHAICEHCTKKRRFANNEDINAIEDYLAMIDTYSRLYKNYKISLIGNLSHCLDKKTLREINRDTYWKLRTETEVFMSKNRKVFAEKFVEQSKNEICEYLNKKLNEKSALRLLRIEILTFYLDKLPTIFPKNKVAIKGYVPYFSPDWDFDINLDPSNGNFETRATETIDTDRKFFIPVTHYKYILERLDIDNDLLTVDELKDLYDKMSENIEKFID